MEGRVGGVVGGLRRKSSSARRVDLTWQFGDVGGQQLGSLLLVALLRDVT